MPNHHTPFPKSPEVLTFPLSKIPINVRVMFRVVSVHQHDDHRRHPDARAHESMNRIIYVNISFAIIKSVKYLSCSRRHTYTQKAGQMPSARHLIDDTIARQSGRECCGNTSHHLRFRVSRAAFIEILLFKVSLVIIINNLIPFESRYNYETNFQLQKSL